MTKKFGVALDDELGSYIEDQLEYGDSRSKWINEACELRRVMDEYAEGQLEYDNSLAQWIAEACELRQMMEDGGWQKI